MIKEIEKINFANSLLIWYKKHKRDLPWRKTKDPYKIWVSEIILQQTRIDQGISYYRNFIEKFPNIQSLANSSEKNVLKNWEGLGYYSRAINMLYNAKKIVWEKKKMPSTFEELIKLKGVGEYTAAAISSICFCCLSNSLEIESNISRSENSNPWSKNLLRILLIFVAVDI